MSCIPIVTNAECVSGSSGSGGGQLAVTTKYIEWTADGFLLFDESCGSGSSGENGGTLEQSVQYVSSVNCDNGLQVTHKYLVWNADGWQECNSPPGSGESGSSGGPIGDCGECITDPDAPCGPCAAQPSYFILTISGITNAACEDCNTLNGVWNLCSLNCLWQSVFTSVGGFCGCSEDGGGSIYYWQFQEEGGTWFLNESCGNGWTSTDFDCVTGSGTWTFTPGLGSCDFTGATFSLIPCNP